MPQVPIYQQIPKMNCSNRSHYLSTNAHAQWRYYASEPTFPQDSKPAPSWSNVDQVQPKLSPKQNRLHPTILIANPQDCHFIFVVCTSGLGMGRVAHEKSIQLINDGTIHDFMMHTSFHFSLDFLKIAAPSHPCSHLVWSA